MLGFGFRSDAPYRPSQPPTQSSTETPAGTSTWAVWVAKLTVAATPGSAFNFFSIPRRTRRAGHAFEIQVHGATHAASNGQPQEYSRVSRVADEQTQDGGQGEYRTGSRTPHATDLRGWPHRRTGPWVGSRRGFAADCGSCRSRTSSAAISVSRRSWGEHLHAELAGAGICCRERPVLDH